MIQSKPSRRVERQASRKRPPQNVRLGCFLSADDADQFDAEAEENGLSVQKSVAVEVQNGRRLLALPVFGNIPFETFGQGRIGQRQPTVSPAYGPKWSHKAPGGPGRTDGCCLKGSKLYQSYGWFVVLEVVTRTAGRSIYSYNRSALVPPEAPILPLFGLTLPVRCAAYFGFWTAKPTVSQQDQQHLFRDQIGVLDGNAILFGGVLHNLIFWNR